MDFSEEAGLKWHEKKHNKICLKLGLSEQNDETTADQTPTPTRFIRNCEEVGLFQDLQHVNPFDETFKKAIQSNSNGTPIQTLCVPETTGDDTLHTPHIFPPLEESCEKPRLRKERIDGITLVIDDNVPISYDDGVEKSQTTTTSANGTALSGSNLESEGKTNQSQSVNIKLKQIINSKTIDSQNTKKDVSNSDDCVIVNSVSENQDSSDIQKTISKNTEHFIKKRLAAQRLRECNRKAQERLRNRRKMHQKRMEFNYKFLQAENAKLKAENRYLREELICLRRQTEESSTVGHNDVIPENTTPKKIGTSPLNTFTYEMPIFPKRVPGKRREEFILPKQSSTGPPLILPKPPNTVFLQLPIFQAQTLPILLGNNSQISLTVQNPIIQNSPRKILPLPNQSVENVQVQSNATTNVPASIPTPKKTRKRRKRK